MSSDTGIVPLSIENRTLHLHGNGPVQLAPAPSDDGTVFATLGEADARGPVCVISVNNAQKVVQIVSEPLKDMEDASVTSIALSAEGGLLAMAEPVDGKVLICKRDDFSNMISMLEVMSSPAKRALCFDSTSSKIAIGSDDGSLSVHNPTELNEKAVLLGNAGAAVTCIAWARDNASIAAATAAGAVTVYSISGAAVQVDAASDAGSSPKVAWSPAAFHLAISREDCVELVSFAGHIRAGVTSDSRKLSGLHGCTALAWSPSGRYLMAAGACRRVVMWDSQQSFAVVAEGVVPEVMEGEEHSTATPTDLAPAITGLAWVADGHATVFVDASGHAGTIRTSVFQGTSMVEPQAVASATFAPDTEVTAFALASQSQDEASQENKQEAARAEDAPNAASSNSDAPAPAPSKSYVEGEAEEDKDGDEDGEDDVPNVSLAAEKHKLGFTDADEDGEDAGLRRMSQGDSMEGGPGVDMGDVSDLVERRVAEATELILKNTEDHVKESMGVVPQQPAFQPGSTRLKASASRTSAKRYLVWNGVGAITAREEALETVVDVNFAESSKLAAKHLSGLEGYSLASLSTHGAIFASKYKPPAGSSEEGKPARLRYFLFGSGMAGGSDWTMNLPVDDARMPEARFPKRLVAVVKAQADEEGGEGSSAAVSRELVYEMDTSSAAESPVSLGLGEGWIAVGTDRSNLRFIRTCGAEDAVAKVPGEIVVVAAAGMLCAVVYHTDLPSSNRQRMSVALYRVPDGSSPMSRTSAWAAPTSAVFPVLLGTAPLQLGPHETVQWVGFATNGTLCVHTSAGDLMALLPAAGWGWWTVANTKKMALAAAGLAGKSSNARVAYWPVAVQLATHDVVENAEDLALGNDKVVLPVLAAVYVRGGALEPAVSTPTPLTNLLPLRSPLLDGSTIGSYDAGFIAAEMLRLQRAWCGMQGLSWDKGASSVELDAVNTAATASFRGEDKPAVSSIETARAAVESSDRKDCHAVDKATVKSISAACSLERDGRAMQLLTRLHMVKSLEVAHKVATRAGRQGVAERAMQLMLVKQAEEEGSLTAAGNVPAPKVVLPTNELPPAPSKGPKRFGLMQSFGGLDQLQQEPQAPQPPPVQPSVPKSIMGAMAKGAAPTAGASSRPVGAGINPFKKSMTSPLGKRRPEGLEVLAAPTPDRHIEPATVAGKAPLNRQSSMAVEARNKRAKVGV